jgi:Fe2+-dicitrate sensor, membrane component
MEEHLNLEREVLFFRYCSKKATPEEKEMVEKIIAESGEASAELDKVKEAVLLENRIREMDLYPVSEGYNNVQQKIKIKSRKRRFIGMLLRVAAVAAIPLLISSLALIAVVLNLQPGEEEIAYMEVTSAPGLISRIELPDNSVVWLNAGSSLRYPDRFYGSTREVELKGEGYFEVESDEKHPFLVAESSGLKIKAHGTRFNMNVTEKAVETVLEEGKVDILFAENVLHKLNPGEQAIVEKNNKKLSVREVNVYEKIAWKDGKIIFRNAPLNEVFDRLGKRYNVDIVLHDKYGLSEKYRSRVTFTDETIIQIFTYLEMAAPIEWTISAPKQNEENTELTRQRIDVWLKKK